MADINAEIHKVLKSYFNELGIMDNFKVQGEINYNRLSKIGLAISGRSKKDLQDEVIISKLDEKFKNSLEECKNLFQAIDDCRNMPSIDSLCALWGAAYSIVKDFSEKYGNADQYLNKLETFKPFEKKIILDDKSIDEQEKCAAHIWQEYFGSVLHKNYEGNDFRDIANELKNEEKVWHLGKLCDRIHYIGNDFIHANALSTAIQGAMISMIENMPVTTEREKNDQEKALRLLGKIIENKPNPDVSHFSSNSVLEIPPSIRFPHNKFALLNFWKMYEPNLNEYNSNVIAKDNCDNYPNTYWATMTNKKLNKNWYFIGTDKDNKISKLFHIEAGKFKIQQFGINKNEPRRKEAEPDLREKFEVCLDNDNYIDQIKKEADFSDCLYAIADFNRGEIEWFNKDN